MVSYPALKPVKMASYVISLLTKTGMDEHPPEPFDSVAFIHL
jgi:hypothetical protein